MIQNEVATKYSKALYALGKDEGKLTDYRDELQSFWQLIEDNNDLRKILFHPRILPQNKKRILRKIFAEDIPANLFNFISLLIDKRRENFLEAIVKGFVQMVNREEDIIEVKVTSAITLSEEIKEQLKEKLSRMLDLKVVIKEEVDPAIIGGLVLKVGDRLIDGSIQHGLNSLRERIEKIPVSELGV